MGNQREYVATGGFSQYLFQDESPQVTINGVTGKMISKVTDPSGMHSGLPRYGNTSEIYFKKGENGLASQARVYKDRYSFMDIDWNHTHTNPNGAVFPKGTIHVQVYKLDTAGNLTRLSSNARLMTAAEFEKYGPIIKYFNPNVKCQ